MVENKKLADCRIAVIGLGLMGGSLALALRGKCRAIFGVDRDPDIVSIAQKHNIIDRGSLDPRDALSEAQVIVLATPVRTIINILNTYAGSDPADVVVIDLGSTKRDIVEAMASLPEGYDPIGGHPMCGKEKSSLLNADPNLFQAAAFALVPLPRTTWAAHSIAVQMVDALGAFPLWLNAETHDRWTSITSHFPFLLSNVLAYIAPQDVHPLVGSGFRSTSRLAVTDPSIMLDILFSNKDNLLKAMDQFQDHLGELREMIVVEDMDRLAEHLGRGAESRRQLLATRDFSKERTDGS